MRFSLAAAYNNHYCQKSNDKWVVLIILLYMLTFLVTVTKTGHEVHLVANKAIANKQGDNTGDDTKMDGESENPEDGVKRKIVNITYPVFNADDPVLKDAPCGKNSIYWVEHNRCVTAVNKSLSWRDAFTECILTKGSLLSIPHKEDFDWVKDNLKLGTPIKAHWIGGTDIAREGSWVWVDAFNDTSYTTPITYYMFEWETHPEMENNDCLLYQHPHWEHQSCQAVNPFICEIKAANKCRIDNGGCEHLCYPTNKEGVKCWCHHGFLLTNTTQCADINECLINNGNCENACANAQGSYNCTCGEFKKLVKGVCEPINLCEVDNFGCEQICEFEHGVNDCECENGFVSYKKKCFKIGSSAKNIILVLIIIASLASVPVSILLIIKTQHKLRKQQTSANKAADTEGADEGDSESEDSESGAGSGFSGGSGEDNDKKLDRGTSVDVKQDESASTVQESTVID